MRLALFALLMATPVIHVDAQQDDSSKHLIPRHATWQYLAGSTKAPAGWLGLEFAAKGWKSGSAGFGYGDDDDRTVLREMRGRHSSLYTRRTFQVNDVKEIKNLYLYVNYDDGFIAYLNGHQVASSSAIRDGQQVRVALHEAQGSQEFVIEDFARLLRKGGNVLAIEGHNAAIDSSDFTLDAVLTTLRVKTTPSTLSPADYLADIDELEDRLFDQSSYLTRRGFDAKKALQELRASISATTQPLDFSAALLKIVMQIGDCHANVRGTKRWPLTGFLPFRIADTDKGFAVLNLNLPKLLDEDHPYVHSIDGVPIEKWLDAASRYVPRGSDQLVRRRSLSYLALFTVLRSQLKVAPSKKVKIELQTADGSSRTAQTLRLTREGSRTAQLKFGPSRRLEGDIGYLRIPVMDGRLVDAIVRQIKAFRDTNGLIIDVRGNGGGRYSILNAVYGYFVAKDAEPYVTNIAAFRLSRRFFGNHIEYRPTHREDWKGWSDRERKAIRKAAEAFRPEWTPPEGKFSEWHYMLLSRERGGQDYFHYEKPVVVLCDAGSFSATDGFLSAFADLPGVTLLGEPSAGGSGSTRRFRLTKTGTQVALSSMASFRANGKTFDGNGIEVDILAKPIIEDYLSKSADSVIDRAIRLIRKQAKTRGDAKGKKRTRL